MTFDSTMRSTASLLTVLLTLCAAFLWWRRPMRGALAAWLNLSATGVAVLAFGVVHPFLTRAVSGA